MTANDITQSALDRSIVSLGDSTRLHRVFEKARRGEPIVVGVIGGSITQGACASSTSHRYCNHVVEWLREQLAPAVITLVNAGRGATGSNYASLRANRDLLCQSPDLVILEFAVNDGVEPIFGETLEGLLRQVMKQPQSPAVLMLFMMHRGGRNAQERLGPVGVHYGVPMTSYRDALWPEIEAKRLTWDGISPDEVHPNDLGHELAARFVTHLIEQSLKQPPRALLPALPSSLNRDDFERTTLLEATSLIPTVSQGWTLEAHADPWPCWVANTPGSSISFEVDGTTVLLMFYRKNAPFGRAAVRIDDCPETTHDAWFEQTWGGYRETVVVASDLPPGVHHVTVRILEDRNPKSSGDEFRVLGLGLAGVAK